jgi:hypothetical protein
VKVRTKILLLSSVAFLCFYIFGITETQQSVLVGSASVSVDNAQADDSATGAGLAPIVYGLFPFLLLLVSGLVSWFLDRRKKSN